MTRIVKNLLAMGLVLCSALLLTRTAFAAAWPPTAQEAFGKASLEVLNTDKQAVALMTRIEPHPPTLGMILIPEFHSADGQVVGRISFDTRQKLEDRYKSIHGSDDGFDLFVVNLCNDYRGLPQVTQRDMEEYHQRLRLASAEAATARDARQLTDLSGLTHEQLFQGIDINILDRKTPAVDMGSYEWPMQTMHFFDADHNILGHISAEDYLTILERAIHHYETIINQMPGGAEIVYAQLFNDARGVRRATLDEYLAYCGVNRTNLSGESWAALGELFELPAQNGTEGSAASASATVDASGYPSEIVRLTNRQRTNEGLPALTQDPQLMVMAALRAQELARQMSHTRPGGQSATAWVLEETGSRSAGENIASGYALPQHVVGGWMDSSGHRANILKESYTRMGAGCYQDPDTLVTYWVQLFAS